MNELFFQDDIEGLSYFLGMLFSDGHINTKGKYIQIFSTDEDVIRKLHKRLNNHGSVHISKRGEYKTMYILKSCTSFYNYIISLGVQNNKDLHSIASIKIRLNIFDFCRGFLDGDGHYRIRKYTNQNVLHYINFLGRETIIKEIYNQINVGKIAKRSLYSPKSKQLYRLNVYGKDANELGHLMYDNATIFMKRKHKCWQECKDNSQYKRVKESTNWGITYRTDAARIRPWRVDFTKNKIRYMNYFTTLEDAVAWRDLQNQCV